MKHLLSSHCCPQCVSGDAAELHEGRSAVCGLWVQWGRGNGGGRRGEGGCQWNKQDKVGDVSHFYLFFILFSFHFIFTVKEGSALFFNSSSKKGGGFGGMFGMLKGLVGSKSLTREDMESVLDKMRDHLIGMTLYLRSLFQSSIWFSAAFNVPFFLFFFFAFSAKNVAADIATQLCDSVANKLEGKVMGTFTSEYILSI